MAKVSTSVPVVSVMLRAPAAAVELMLKTAVAEVAEFTVRLVTVMPAPKLAVVVPCTQCVYWPVKATDKPVCPC